MQLLKRWVCSTVCLHTQFHSKLFVSIPNSTPTSLSPYPIPLQTGCLHILFHSKLVVSIINSILNLIVSVPISSQTVHPSCQVIELIKERIGLNKEANGYSVFEVFGNLERNMLANEKVSDAMFKWEKFARTTNANKALRLTFKVIFCLLVGSTC